MTRNVAVYPRAYALNADFLLQEVINHVDVEGADNEALMEELNM